MIDRYAETSQLEELRSVHFLSVEMHAHYVHPAYLVLIFLN